MRNFTGSNAKFYRVICESLGGIKEIKISIFRECEVELSLIFFWELDYASRYASLKF